MLKRIVFIEIPLLITLSFAQGPDTLWTKTYGGANTDDGYSVQQTLDGGYIIAAVTWSFGIDTFNVYLIKTDSLGDTLWTKTYGGMGACLAMDVEQTSDSGYIMTGVVWANGSNNPCLLYLVKTDSSGDTLWTKIYGPDSGAAGHSVQQTLDGGYIIAGNACISDIRGLDLWLLKTDANGDTVWSKTYGGIRQEWGFSVQQTSDGGYIVAGCADSAFIDCDVYLVKTDSLGDTLWVKVYGGSDWDGGFSVQQTSDGGYIVAGVTHSFGVGPSDGWVLKTDSSGDTVWTRTYGGTDGDIAYSVKQTSDGGYIIAGSSASFGPGVVGVYLIRTNSFGDTLWTNTYGGTGIDEGQSVIQTMDGGYIIAGFTESFGAGWRDVYLIKIAPEPGIEEEKVESVKNSSFGATIFSGPLLLPEGKNCKVFDITGRVVLPQHIKPGIYFIEVDGIVAKKIIKIR